MSEPPARRVGPVLVGVGALVVALAVAGAGLALWARSTPPVLDGAGDAASGPPPPTADELAAATPHLEAALAALGEPGGAERASRSAARAREAAPRLAEAHVAEARALQRLLRWDAAIAAWDRAVALDPGVVIDALATDLHRDRADVRGALARWLGALAGSSDPNLAAAGSALLATRRGASPPEVAAADAAVAELEMAVGREPRATRVRHARALVRWRLGQWDHAIADADVLVAQSPEVGVHRLLRGRWRMEVRQWPEARDELERALALAPDLADAHLELGILALREWDARTARERFERCRALAPDDARAIAALGACACHAVTSVQAMLSGDVSGRVAEARARADEAEAIEPLLPEVDVVRAWATYFEDDFDGAMRIARRAEERAGDPRWAEAVSLAIFCDAALGRFDELDARTDAWREVSPDAAEPLLTKAMALAVANPPRPVEAERAFAAAEREAPRDPTALLRHAAILVAPTLRGERDPAERLLGLLARASEVDAAKVDAFWASFGSSTRFVAGLARRAAQAESAAPVAGNLVRDAQRRVADGDFRGAERAYLEVIRVGLPHPLGPMELARLYLHERAPELLERDPAELHAQALDRATRAVELCEAPDRRAARAPALAVRAIALARLHRIDEANAGIAEAHAALEAALPLAEPTAEELVRAWIRQAEEAVASAAGDGDGG